MTHGTSGEPPELEVDQAVGVGDADRAARDGVDPAAGDGGAGAETARDARKVSADREFLGGLALLLRGLGA
ncbi:hypothetical protein ACIPSH_04215 [Streptomyces iakyrus]|uniref:hypothetical protein n=1 Tax=Streptomyces iakyrus TaxID=68219 RepID=UPI0038206CC1